MTVEIVSVALVCNYALSRGWKKTQLVSLIEQIHDTLRVSLAVTFWRRAMSASGLGRVKNSRRA